jgi:hypothetical protein
VLAPGNLLDGCLFLLKPRELALKIMLKFPLPWVARLGVLGTSAMALLLLGLLPVVAQVQTPILISQARNSKALEYVEKGQKAFLARDYNGAVAHFGQAIRLAPKWGSAYIYLG